MVRITVPAPRWTETWPRGLTPQRVASIPEGLELVYASPAGHRAHARLEPRDHGVIVRVARSTFPEEGSARLVAALERAIAPDVAAVRADAARSAAVARSVDATLRREVVARPTPPSGDDAFAARLAEVSLLDALARASRTERDAILRVWGERLSASTDFVRRFALALVATLDGFGERACDEMGDLARGGGSYAERRALAIFFAELGLPERAADVLLANGGRVSRTPRDALDLARWALGTRHTTAAHGVLGDLLTPGRGVPEDIVRDALELAIACEDPGMEARLRALRASGVVPDAVDRALAERALASRDTRAARALLAPYHDHEAADLRAIADVLDHELAAAMAALEASLVRAPRSRRMTLFLAYAHLLADDPARAREVLSRFDRSVVEDDPVGKLLLALVRHGDGQDLRADPTRYLHRAIVRDVLDARLDFDAMSRADEIAHVHAAVRALGGSIGRTLTVARSDGSLQRVREGASARVVVTTIQRTLAHRPAEQVQAALRRYAELHPDVPFGDTYAAEIDLWLGRYDIALEAFERSWQRSRTRWAYVGSGASLLMLGRVDEALARFAEGEAAFGGLLPSEATHAYRAEAYAMRGRLDDARAGLEHAVRARPRRVGAWVALASVALRQGDRARASEAWREAEAYGPALVRDVSSADGRPLEEVTPERVAAALARLRGNRSSYVLTFFDARTRLRVVPLGDGYAERIGRAARFLLESLAYADLEA